MGGVQGVGHEFRRLGRPFDDVDLLVLELLHDAVHAAAARADAGADRVHVRVHGVNGDLGAAAGFPGDGLDLHDARGDLRHFHFKQALDQARMAAGHPDLGGRAGMAGRRHLQDVHLEVVALVVFLARHKVAGLHDALGAAQLQQDGAGVGLQNDTGQDLVFLVAHLVVDAAVLRLAQALHDDLLGGHGRHAAKVGRGHVDFHDVVRLAVRGDFPGLLQGDLVGLVLNLLTDELPGEHLHALLPGEADG